MEFVTTIKIFTVFTLILPTNGFPGDGSCVQKDCTLQEWTQWSVCSESCGDKGISSRTRLVLQEASCGGHCNYNTSESIPCNRQCCPKNCLMDSWYAWSCICTSTCAEPGARIKCTRTRFQIYPASCGGYCDDRRTEKTCHTLCCHKDCAYAGWMQWLPCRAQCEQMGTQVRRKLIMQRAQCGGEVCSVPTEERECLGSCCPEDCVQGEWSRWSECPATCGKANLTRTRYVEEPKCNGKPCLEPVSVDFKECEKYNDVDCKVSPWSQWTQCQLDNGRCGPGKQERIRSILVDSFCHGTPCPDLIEKKNCSGPCCVQDCIVTGWTDWTYCSATCGKGISQRTRNITTNADCKGSPCPKLLESRDCEETTAKDCEFGKWTQWSACSTDCGEGVKIRSRTMLTPAYCNGKCVDSATEETTPCTSHEARRDCQVSEWSLWSECERNCNTGSKKRYRNVTMNPVCGGMGCNMNLVETSGCHPKCSHLCNQGVCSCKEGYELQPDGYSCRLLLCKWPRAKHCPKQMGNLDQCHGVEFKCPQGQGYKGTCIPRCEHEGFVVKGSPKVIECLKNKTWTINTLYCGLENRAPLGITINATEINENWPVGTCFAVLTTVVENEPLDTHTYTLVSESTGTIEIAHKDKLCLRKEASYENEATREFDVSIKSTDYDGLSVTETFHLTVLNANDPPRSAKLLPNRIPENSREGTKVGCLEVKDDDPGQTMSVFLLSSAGNRFELAKEEDGTSCIKLLASSDPRCYTIGGKFCTLDYETRDSYYITVLVQDDGEPQMMTVFDLKIYITDVNEKPRKLSLLPKDVMEEVKPGEALAQIIVEDDAQQSHTYEILSNPSELFSIKGDNLVAAEKLDYESNKDSKYRLKIRVTDNGQPPMEDSLDLVFGVGDVNEPPFNLHVTPDNSKLNYDVDHPKVKENVKGEIIGTVSVYDPDENENVTLKVISTYGAISLVSPRCVPVQNINNYCSAQIRMNNNVDYEKIKEFQITVMATDRRKVRITSRMTVMVLDANDPPEDILLNGQTSTIVKVPEDQRSFTLATISAVDDDKGDNHEYFLSGEAASNFRVEGNQLMTSPTADLDFETHGTSTLIITAEDSGTPSQTFQKTFTISIIDMNEAPSDIALSNNEVSEGGAVGTVIGTLTAEDPDNYEANHQTFIFTLPENARGRFGVKGDKLVVAKPSMRCGTELCHLDFETQSQIKITVRATDNGRPRMSYEKAFTINILDVNDPPENLRLTRSSLRENMPAGTVVGSLNADDDDDSQTLTFTVVDSPEFMINNGNHLVTSKPLNYEEEFRHEVKVKVTDNGVPPASIESVMSVTVLDVNEPPEFAGSSFITVPEDADIGSVIANLTLVDPDTNDKVQVSLSKFQDLFMTTQTKCSIQEPSGTVCISTVLSLTNFDYDKKQLYAIPVVAKDNKGEEVQQLLTIKIENTNDPPHDLLLDGISTYKIDIDENVHQIDVATLSTVDRDKDQTHTYTIKYQDGDNFAVIGNILRLAKPADHEKNPELQLTLRVTDSGAVAQSLEKTITVIVKDVNEQPSKLSLSNNKVVENSEEDTIIGNFIAEDPDNADSDRQLFTFHLIDSADGRFKVEGDQLMVAQSNRDCLSKGGDFCHLDYEKKKTYSVQVAVSDDGVPVKTNRFTLEIQVTDDNDAPRNLQLSNNEVEELAATDTEIGQLTVEDQDVGQTHTIALLDDSGGLFKLSSANSVMKATDERLDNKKTYMIKVQATDNGDTPKEVVETFYLTVSGTEEAPRDISITSQKGVHQFSRNKPLLPEDAAAESVLGTLSAVDNDPGSVITFELLDNADGHFMIANSPAECKPEGKGTLCITYIKVFKDLDFESDPEHSLVVRAVDKQGMQSSKAFTIQVTDVNEPPTDMAYIGGDILVSENHNGELLSVLTVKDPDKDDTHTFSLTDDAGGKFIISENGQLETAQDADIDYETESLMKITVKVEDKGGLQLEKNFRVKVHDLNEQPQALAITNNTVSENSAKGTEVGKLVVTDPDNARDKTRQTFNYTLLDDAGGRFTLNGDILKVAQEGDNCLSKGGLFCLLDFESKRSHDIAIEVADNGDPKMTNTFGLTISILNTNDPPTDLSLDKSRIPEEMSVGEKIGTLSALDQDLDQELRFSISEGDASEIVRIDGTDLILSSAVDFEEKSVYSLTVSVKDTGTPPSETNKDFILNVVNNNEAPTLVSVEPVKGGLFMNFPTDKPLMKENEPEGTVIGQLIVLDPDKEEEITAVAANPLISIDELGCITLTKGTRCVGNIKSEAIFDFEDEPTFTSDITVTDTGGQKLQQTFVFSVKDENDAPEGILIDGSSDGTLTVEENSVDVVVGTVTAVDADVAQTYSFAVVDGPQFFYFVGNKLKLTTTAELDYERASEFQVTLSVTDDGKPPAAFEKHITVKVKDKNEAPTDVALSKNEIAEDSRANTVVGTLSTDDPDNERKMVQRFTYSLTDDDDGRFKVAGDQLLVAKPHFNYEIQRSTVVKGTVTDDGSPPMSAEFEFIIHIADANDHPKNLKFSANSISEDAEVGKVVGLLSADDDDVGQILSFSIPDNDLLTIRDAQVLVNGLLNFETNPTITFTVFVTDDGEPSLNTSKQFSIDVTNVNDKPDSLELLPVSGKKTVEVSESMEEGELVGRVVAADEDSLERITFSLIAPTDGTLKLDAGGASCGLASKDGLANTECSITILLGTEVDYEQLTSDSSSMSVEVVAEDKGGLTITNRWNIPIKDTNDPPTDITIDGNKTSIPENLDHYLIGSLQSVDEDRKDSHIYQVLDYWKIFKVTRENELLVTRALDFEKKSEYEVRIKSVDSGVGHMTITKTFTFTVTDVNEKPSAISLSHDEVSMAAPVDSVVGFIEVADPDNEDDVGEKQTFTCVANTEGNLFKIDKKDNSLKVNTILPAKKDIITVSVTCNDDGVPKESLTSEVMVKVMESADVPKSVGLEGNLEVDENDAPKNIGTLSVINALNQEEISGSFSFSVETSSEEAKSPFSVDGKSLMLTTPLDYEASDEVHVNISVTGTDDQNQEVSTHETFLIIVKDINESPTHIGIYSDTVPENSPVGTIVGDLNTVDVEREQSYTYTLLGVSRGVEVTTPDPELSSMFEIQGPTLVVGTATQHLDYEKSTIFSLLVQTADSGSPSLSYSGTVRIRVLDRNDAPTGIQLDKHEVLEESPVGTVVGMFTILDEDQNQKHSCEVENIQYVPFQVKDDLKLVVSRDELDHEGTRNYVVKVTCQDEGDDGSFLKVTSSFTIIVTNVNDPPYNISLSSEEVAENAAPGGMVALIKALDPDSDKITFEVVDQNGNFALKGDNTLIAVKAFNYEETSEVTLTVKVTDTGGLSSTKEFLIKVVDVNEAPISVSLSGQTLAENARPGTVIGTLRTEDEDHGQTFSYSLTQEELSKGYFVIDGDKLIAGNVPMDFEKFDFYTISITSTDNGDLPLKKQVEFNITVTDVNEPPTAIITQPIDAIPENSDVGLVLSVVNVEDQETGQSYSCHVTDTDTPFMMQTYSNGTMILILNDKLNYEAAKSIDITISCQDGPYEITKDITVTIADVNEAPTQINLDGPMLLPATGEPGYVIGHLTAEDPDIGQTHTFTVRGANSDIAQVKEKNKLTLIKILPMDTLIDQASPELVLTIQVVDNGYPNTLSLEQQLKFLITDIDIEALKLPEVTISNKRIKEEAELGTVIGALYNINMTIGDNVVFEIIEDANKLFAIKNDTHLVLASSLVGITTPSVKVTVQARNRRSQQTTSRTITIFIIKSAKCKRDGKDCDFDAKCMEVNSTYEYCQCNPGFVGDGYECTDFNDCSNASEPCQNGATCVDGLNSYTCKCADGYAGKQCEIKEDERTSCFDNECQNDAACEVDKDDITKYKCICDPGWTGRYCNKSVDDCLKSSCYGKGKCIDRHQTYVCECSPDRVGVRCQYFKSSCLSTHCKAGSETCIPKFQKKGFECIRQQDVVLLKIIYSPSKSDEVTARLVDFITLYGRFPNRAGGITGRRKKRSADTTSNVHPYIVGVKEVRSGVYETSFVVQDSQDVTYTESVVLNSLNGTCSFIDPDGQTETLFCPAVRAAIRQIIPKEGSPTEEGGGGLSPGVAAGAGGGAIVIIIAVFIGVVCFRKHSARRVNNSETNLQPNRTTDDESKTATSSVPPPPPLPPPSSPPPPPPPPPKLSKPHLQPSRSDTGSLTPVET